ncbi:transcriptional regulator, TetR family [Alkalithermobacter thermoalcaliphilus JW-YL-7 = DSM 7308]|uniref:Transcriptional regulator, TetR family n=1 Tax=Alkalithermobacter thermoalcaliphilus JW-YL-7 = DSM 7308 TaxID=1121328 RepID=A0A150FP95_CLOPD|nr:transcriptional regulator, TetR family [[Clostridium] paradoxum JW-YL-7 = DSM 7308]SHK54347.1 transcriptional regulator, TetR family [[Clostridium] paradoxum JW-YL-7 = DSM 7308]
MSDKSFEKRDELIKVAIDEFGENGYDKASLNNILKKANISKGTFYYHFKNKEELYIYLVEMLIQEKKKFFIENVDANVFAKDIFTIFIELGKAGIKFAKENPSISKFSESFIREKGNSIYNKVTKRFNFQNDDYMNALIEASYERGEIRDDLPKEFVKNVISYLFTNITEIVKLEKITDYEEAINNLIKFLKDGLSSS